MTHSSQPPSDPSARVDEFMKLHSQCQRRVFVYILSLVHNVTDAEDLLQETNYILWKKFDEFQPGSNFAAWACRIGYLEVLKFRERSKHSELSLSPQFLERIQDRMAKYSDVLEDRTEAFDDCMKLLDESDRVLITRRYAVGVTLARLAAELKRPVRSLAKSLVRVRKTLLKCIDRHTREEKRR